MVVICGQSWWCYLQVGVFVRSGRSNELQTSNLGLVRLDTSVGGRGIGKENSRHCTKQES